MGFSSEFLERVREANNIVDLIGQYTVLRSSGSNHMGRCMFHNDRTASLSVSEGKQVYHCFGCKASGNIFSFVQAHLGLTFPDAVAFLAERAGLKLEHDNNQQPQSRDTKDPFYSANQTALDAYKKKLKYLDATSEVKSYIQTRGLSDEIVDEFELGYAPESWDFIYKRLQADGAPAKVLRDCGLLATRKSGSGFYDRFRDRLIFPIKNSMGRCIGFGGRILQKGEPKYLNSPESPLFHKSRVLYGLNYNSKFIRSQDEVIVVEGYMDLISLAQFGVRNVAATLGTALTIEHAKLLKRLTKNVVVVFDGDTAGILAAEKSLPILLKAGLIPRGLTLENKQDPDDFIRANGEESFRELVKSSPQLFDQVVSRWLTGYRGSASEKMKLVGQLAPLISEISDQALRGLYLRELAAKLNVDGDWLRKALWQQIKNATNRDQNDAAPSYVQQNHFQNPQEPRKISLRDAARAELTLLGLALKTRENFNLIQDSGVSSYLVHEGIKTLFSRASDKYRQDPEGFDKLLASVLPFVDRPEKLSVAFEGAGAGDSLNEHRLIEDCIEKVKELHLKQRGSHLSVKVKMNPNSSNLEEFINVHKQRLGLRNIKEDYEIED